MNHLFVTLTLSLVLTVGCSSFKKDKDGSEDQTKKENADPKLTLPTVKKIWVEDKIQGNRYIMGHFEYVIEQNSTWSD